MLAAMLLLGAGCGPKETNESVAATETAIDQQQEAYYKQHPDAAKPAEPAGAGDAMVTSGGSGGPAGSR